MGKSLTAYDADFAAVAGTHFSILTTAIIAFVAIDVACVVAMLLRM